MTTEGEQQEAVCGRCGDGEPIDKEMDANHRASHGHPFTPAPVVHSDERCGDCEALSGMDNDGRFVLCEQHAQEYEAGFRDALRKPATPTPSQDAEGDGLTIKDRLSGHVIVCAEHGRAHLTLASDFEERFAEIESAIREPYEALVKAARGVLDSRTEFVFENGSGFEETSFEYDENAVACLNAALTRIEESLGGRS